MSTTTYNVAGHVCPDTGRLAMTVADAYAREDSPDRHFWLYSEFAAEAGIECWSLLDGLDGPADPNAEGHVATYTLDLTNGRSMNVQGGAIVYMQRTKAERDPRYTIDLESAGGIRVSLRGVAGKDAAEAESYARQMMAAPAWWKCTGIDRERT